MNHYERLKVSQDAPAEVIRAAYRALAGRLQQGPGGTGLEDEAQSELGALNAAYEVLIDPKHRQEYDATLLRPTPDVSASVFAPAVPPNVREGIDRLGVPSQFPAPASTRVNMDWTPPGVVSSAQPLWPPSRRHLLLGGGALAVIILATAVVSWQVMGQRQIERAMSSEYTAKPDGDAAPDGAAPPQDVAAASQDRPRSEPARPMHQPSVAELAQMSDDELLAVLPSLDEEDARKALAPRQSAKAAAARNGQGAAGRAPRHLLDGSPLNLRTDSTLIDPLAPAPGAKPSRR